MKVYRSSDRPSRKAAEVFASLHEKGLLAVSPDESAFETVWGWQKGALVGLTLLAVAGLALHPVSGLMLFNAVATLGYLAIIAFRFYTIHRAERRGGGGPESAADAATIAPPPDDGDLPVYTILCPLYQEAETVGGYIRAMIALDYPLEKLDIRILLEENDPETREAAQLEMDRQGNPTSIQIITLPDSQPKTKPKACNYGLRGARGEYAVIYDAEDIPERDQLRKALAAFARLPAATVCLQAKLNYFNPEQNLLTRFFTAEYSMWFDLFLPGLSAVGSPIPLGGTSNHFRMAALRELGAWDPFNVAEDADLGMRIARRGWTTAVLDSTTWEEANSRVGNWVRQRSRWIKGYMQAWLVTMRQPVRTLRTLGPWRFFCFQAAVGGTPFVLLLNPVYWALTGLYVLTRLGVIPQLFPPPVFAISLLSALLGNLVFIYLSIYGLFKRERYSLVPLMFLSPLYWVLQSVAAWKALYQLVVKPHYWEKTTHNLAPPPIEAAGVPEGAVA